MGKRKKTHEFEDQYGERHGQDRDEFPPAGRGGGSMRGGGGAGGGRGGANVNFQRQLPKFLQPYAHMLGQQGPSEDEPLVEGGDGGGGGGGEGAPRRPRGAPDDDSDGDGDGDEEAIQRALQENPELAAELGERVTKRIEAVVEKEAGNKAFAAKQYEAAITHFTKAIELDATSEVFFSNRSAALSALERFQPALDDARAAVRIKPRWAKGHVRAAAALMGLKRYGEAREAYEAALKLEPDDQALQRGRDKAYAMELQQVRENKHTFANKRPKGEAAPGGAGGGGGGGGGGGRGEGGGGSGVVRPPIAAARKDKKLLSFGGDEDEEG